jgi:hypothetical protein
MAIFGISILLISGVINFLLLLFQLLSGLHIIKTKLKFHRTAGKVLFVIASMHAILAILVN